MRVDCAHDEIVELSRLQPNPRNPNKHPARQIDMLAKIIAYQGQRAPIVVSKRSGFIVKGHGRLEAIKSLAWTKAAVDYQDYEDEAQEFADMIADNKISELAEHDDELMKLTALDLQLDTNGFDLDLLGLPDLDLSMPDEAKDATEDDVPEVTKSISKLGDLYELGEHRLLCGDSTSAEAVAMLMAGAKADMVYMDPPYGMNLNTDYAVTSSVIGKTYKPVIGDDVDFDPTFFLELFKEAREHFWWGADYYCQRLPKGGSWVVWDKKKDDLDESIGTGYELCWSMVPHKRMLARFLWSGFTAKERNECRVHPTQKPVALHVWFFDRWGKENDNLVDLFGGSGSTLIACEKTKRKCFMMELDPHYIDVIVSRWCKYTGKTSIKRNGEPMEWTI